MGEGDTYGDEIRENPQGVRKGEREESSGTGSARLIQPEREKETGASEGNEDGEKERNWFLARSRGGRVWVSG